MKLGSPPPLQERPGYAKCESGEMKHGHMIQSSLVGEGTVNCLLDWMELITAHSLIDPRETQRWSQDNRTWKKKCRRRRNPERKERKAIVDGRTRTDARNEGRFVISISLITRTRRHYRSHDIVLANT